MSERYDIAIVGSGPAGLSAALNAKIRNKSFIIFGNRNLSSKIEKAPGIDNYLGFHNISGNDLKEKFQEHIKEMGIEIAEYRIDSIYAMGSHFVLMSNDKSFEATSIILATGIEYTKPLVGELEHLGRGVSYCATCDANFYKKKKVAILGYNKDAERDANYVSEIASEVYYIPMYKEPYSINESIAIIKDKPKKILNEDGSRTLVLDNNEIKVDGIFIIKDSISPAQLVPGLLIEEDHISVDRYMKTNIKGCFAAGDCVGKPYQYIKAAGEGNIASLSAVKYLDGLRKK